MDSLSGLKMYKDGREAWRILRCYEPLPESDERIFLRLEPDRRPHTSGL